MEYNLTREERERKQTLKLIKEYFEYVYQDYHYIYPSPYSKPIHEITCFTENSQLATDIELTELDKDYLRCYDKPLISIKNLGRYDCWEDKDPKEWLEICRNNVNGLFDGKSPMYENNE